MANSLVRSLQRYGDSPSEAKFWFEFDPVGDLFTLKPALSWC